MNFSQQLAFGKIGESYIANWFKRYGYSAIPIYEKQIDEGKGPQVFTPTGQLIAPDMLVFNRRVQGDRRVIWVEAKHKSAFTWHRITNRWTTGIDLHHYEHYLSVATISPWPIWLLFLHQNGCAKDTPAGMISPSGLFGNDLNYLQHHENHRHMNWGKSGMVYWAHEALRQLATLDEVLEANRALPPMMASQGP